MATAKKRTKTGKRASNAKKPGRISGPTKPETGGVNVNVRWFKEQILKAGISQRSIAKLLGINQSIISHMFAGRRRMSIVEADQWAEILKVPVSEVLINAGVQVPESLMATIAGLHGSPQGSSGIGGGSAAGGLLTLPVSGWIDNTYRIHWEAPKTGPKRAENPLGGTNGDLVCIRYQTAGTPLDGVDGGLVYFRRVPPGTFDYEAIGRFSVVRVKGVHFLRVPKRAYTAGKHNLYTANGVLVEEGVVVEEATPVVWVRF